MKEKILDPSERLYQQIFAQHSLGEAEKTISEGLAKLTRREEQILRMHHGIGEKRAYSAVEIGQKFAVTGERIRQIKKKAEAKLVAKLAETPEQRKELEKAEEKKMLINLLRAYFPWLLRDSAVLNSSQLEQIETYGPQLLVGLRQVRKNIQRCGEELRSRQKRKEGTFPLSHRKK